VGLGEARPMRRDLAKSYVFSGMLLILLGVWIVFHSFTWKYYTSLGPGPGFFPFWIGLLIAGLGALLCGIHLIALKRDRKAGLEIGSRGSFTVSGLRNVGVVIGTLVLCSLVMKSLGFVLTIGLFSFFHLYIVGKRGWIGSVVLSLLLSVGLFSLFRIKLKIPLPIGVFGF